ncbi:aromatic acid exporter family protein [Paenibacillus spongiae]|uniref:Aromatic acid exporter family protein n=1 Tax=Paenibacillus spongiae TaxID=2909671 RepID=A0ABY5S1H4_9BACL|nr:aromatic acid exporter family protein [Paenibacillus spongiae]UVI27707.1 aromatic acid exporter family protein [Paenibacillus spongiae]
MGIRVVKTALAALAALYTATYMGLEPPLSAGLLAILGVEVTRMKGIKSALARFAASVLGLFFASILFALFGFHLWTVSLFILIAFPLLSRVYLKDGIVTSAVIVFHIYAKGEVTAALIGNEIMLLLTGLGWATVINLLYMPKEDKRLDELRHLTEQKFGEMFEQMAKTLRNPALVWNGEELLEAGDAIEEGLRRADVKMENRLWGQDMSTLRYWQTYFEMRRQQMDSIQLMLVQLSFVYEKLPHGELVAELFDHLAHDVKSDVYEGNVERSLSELEARFRGMDLPATREEFEIRAALLHVMQELDRCLAIAKRWKKHKTRQTVMIHEQSL